MKKLTLMCAAVAAAMSMNAQEEIPLTADMWHQWEGKTADDTFWGPNVKIVEDGQVDCVYNIGKDLGQGDMIIGPNSCNGDLYVDLTEYVEEYEGIGGVATPGITVRFFFNREDLQGKGIDKQVDTDSEGNYLFKFSELGDVKYVHLNFTKTYEAWRGGKWPNGLEKAVVESMNIVPKSLDLDKKKLSEEIVNAKLYDDFAKTEDSWKNLQDAIVAAESALESANATAESLDDASKKLSDAVAGLKLSEGYVDLTKDMYMTYESVEDPGEGTKPGEGCAYEIFKLTGMPYGSGNVYYLGWADLSEYDKLIVTTDGSAGKPRFCMNRTTEGGQEADGGMLDIAPDNGKESTKEYLTVDENVFTVDLDKMVENTGMARLHAMKSVGGDVFVTGMYLYKAPKSDDPTAVNAINSANASSVIYNVYGQRVDESYRGIVIKNGKKFINK